MVYENVVSGAFIYALGAIAGRTRSPEQILKDSINFFQQTPTDNKIAGDLLASWGGKFFLIEFKRSISQLPDELKKIGRKDLGQQINENETIRELSERCHFIGYGSVKEEGELSIIDLKFSTYLSNLLNDKTHPFCLNDFLGELSPDGKYGLSSNEFDPYLEYLLNHADSVSKDSSGETAKHRVSGIMTCICQEGKVVYIEYNGYHHLADLLKEKINLSQLLQQQISYTPQADQEIERDGLPDIVAPASGARVRLHYIQGNDLTIFFSYTGPNAGKTMGRHITITKSQTKQLIKFLTGNL